MSTQKIIHLNGLSLKSRTPPLKLSDYKLIAFDMDSTLINIECIDEIASVVGLREEVARITEMTMQGEILDFKESLRQRVKLLKGAPAAALEQVYNQRLRLNPGAQRLLEICRTAGLKSVLVSGGFTYFADRVKALLQIDFARSNALEIKDGYLTGGLVPQEWGEICDGEEKKKMLLQTCQINKIDLSQTITVGDGSNDIPMMISCSSAGGLSVAYHAKPVVRENALLCIDEGGLDRILEFFTS
jgi:phosphoserine phosphatase